MSRYVDFLKSSVIQKICHIQFELSSMTTDSAIRKVI